MKRKLLPIIFCSVCAVSSATAQTLVLHHADGRTTEVELYKKPIVTFSGDRLLVTSPVLSMEYAKDDVLRFTYKDIPKTATVVGRPSDEPRFTQSSDQLTLRGVKPADAVNVYTIDGKQLPVSIRRSGDTAVVPLNAIPAGVYLLSVNGRTTKFTKP